MSGSLVRTEPLPPLDGNRWMREIMDLHAPPLRRFVHRLTAGTAVPADDILQETMLRAWRHRTVLGGDVETQRRWLFTVARRLVIDLARARALRPGTTGVVDVDTLCLTDHDTADRVVARQTIHTALAKLSAQHRTVLVEIYLHGHTTSEVAVRLGLPVGTVKSRTFYALRALHAAVGPMHDE
ncbi:sigma-70 family RNA polymerase sigma factor [Micromonospora marina]|uniref:sigma-70 family RNA polymerase sigma factor n=1 Tax=Micromonospora marina TaxID=307120 RepID=UPI00345432BA